MSKGQGRMRSLSASSAAIGMRHARRLVAAFHITTIQSSTPPAQAAPAIQRSGVNAIGRNESADSASSPQPAMSGCHQPSERFHGTVIPFAWFAQGLRLVDIADPFAPRELGHFLPDPPGGEDRPSSNDVTIDDRGLIYLVDRIRGVDIIETTAFG